VSARNTAQQVIMAKTQLAQAQMQKAVAAKKAETGAAAALGQKLAADVMAKRAAAHAAAESEPASDASAETEVGIQELWDALDRSSESWPLIIDREVKLLTVSEYIDRFRKMHVRVTKPPVYYVGLIDSLAGQLEGFLSAPFSNVLSYAAIVEYDFDNGTDKDTLARNILGEQQFLANRKRVLGK
ncbi:MAG: hypothetical protein WCI27_11735, partial [Candidatus Omnitrophota bacterium]